MDADAAATGAAKMTAGVEGEERLRVRLRVRAHFPALLPGRRKATKRARVLIFGLSR